MMPAFFNWGAKKTKARVNDGGLIVYFGSSNVPTVWRASLGCIETLTFSVRQGDADWLLGLTIKDGFSTLATFDHHQDAEKALCKIQRALMKRESPPASMFTKVMLTIIFIAVAWFYFVRFLVGAPIMTPGMNAQQMTQRTQQGMPVSADALLRAQMQQNGSETGPRKPITITKPLDGVPQFADDVLKPPKP